MQPVPGQAVSLPPTDATAVLPPETIERTSEAPSGVGAPEPVATTRTRRRLKVRFLVLLGLGALSLLGQGEQCRVDTRFASPSATLATFWEALRVGDADGVWECFVEGRHDLPVPGQLWFLPPTDRITLAEFRSLPVTGGRMLVSYEVRYVPQGLDQERSFRTGDELVRLRGQWRIARPLGQASMPEWEPTPRPFDI